MTLLTWAWNRQSIAQTGPRRMKWIQSDYDKSQGLERYFLRSNEEAEDKDDVLAQFREWHATVLRCPDGKWLADIQPEDQQRYDESYVEYFDTLEEAQNWAELEMCLDGKI